MKIYDAYDINNPGYGIVGHVALDDNANVVVLGYKSKGLYFPGQSGTIAVYSYIGPTLQSDLSRKGYTIEGVALLPSSLNLVPAIAYPYASETLGNLNGDGLPNNSIGSIRIPPGYYPVSTVITAINSATTSHNEKVPNPSGGQIFDLFGNVIGNVPYAETTYVPPGTTMVLADGSKVIFTPAIPYAGDGLDQFSETAVTVAPYVIAAIDVAAVAASAFAAPAAAPEAGLSGSTIEEAAIPAIEDAPFTGIPAVEVADLAPAVAVPAAEVGAATAATGGIVSGLTTLAETAAVTATVAETKKLLAPASGPGARSQTQAQVPAYAPAQGPGLFALIEGWLVSFVKDVEHILGIA